MQNFTMKYKKDESSKENVFNFLWQKDDISRKITKTKEK